MKTTTKRTSLLSITLLLTGASASGQNFRSIDGSGNNPNDPEIGRAGIPLLRAAPVDYADGVSSPSGQNRASSREVSNVMSSQTGAIPNQKLVSDFIWQWGQFLDHDIDLSDAAAPTESFDIPVPSGDPFFDPNGTGTEVIPLNRTIWELDENGVRQQINEITAWIDGSNVYGSDAARANELRAFDGMGKLKVSAHATGDMLPFNVNGFRNAPDSSDPSFFLAGDIRANEQICLTAMHTLFVREHNWLCDQVVQLWPGLPDDWYYEVARALVIAEMQKITYEEWIPALLGPGALPPYQGYDSNLDASIGNEFSSSSYRFGHSLLSSSLLRLDANGQVISEGNLALMDAFFDPQRLLDEGGLDPLLRGLATQVCNASDVFVVDDVRNFLFGMPGGGGLDLVALNVQRGRDHGLPDYNTVRMAYGLAPHASFDEISSDANIVAALESIYTSVDDIDPWVGGLAEDRAAGALVGQTVQTVLSDQFLRLRDGDRFFWKRYLPGSLRNWIGKQSLANTIRRNTGIGFELQDDVFHVPSGQGG